MAYYIGVDVGSLSTDVVVIDEGGNVLGSAITLTGANSTKAAETALAEATKKAGIEIDRAAYIVGTGYGRSAIPLAHKTVTEISCHAMGALHHFPDCRTVIDIGGQDSKVILVGPNAKVLNFTMNDKCAAGTGRFLEVMAAKLEITLEDLGRLSLSAQGEVPISSVCTVFAESEIVSLVARNHSLPEIIKGLHRSVVNRVMSMVRSVGLTGPYSMTGGVAKNQGVVALFAEALGETPAVADEPQLVGALGAALIARRDGT
ncbi:MAG: acyl-CoA dehydratase activase [Deltaproteobacteria bacterium]|nr:acyl-CoA dehydratase activase [Deltaproteobacteria bacterium]